MYKKAIEVLLLVEDNPGDARLLREMFKEHGSPLNELIHVESMAEAEKRLAETDPDLSPAERVREALRAA